jgi:hypothetical protein
MVTRPGEVDRISITDGLDVGEERRVSKDQGVWPEQPEGRGCLSLTRRKLWGD